MPGKNKKTNMTTVRLSRSNRDALKSYGDANNISVMDDILGKLLDIHYFNQPRLSKDNESNLISGSYQKLEKPPFALIDTEILLCWETDSLTHWRHYKASKSSKYAANKLPDKWVTKERVELIGAVRQKMKTGYSHEEKQENMNFHLDPEENTWAKLFPKWFALNDYEKQSLSRTVDDRISALVNKGFIEQQPRERRVQVRGQYRMNLIAINPYEWKMLRGISYLPPQKHLHLELLKSRNSGESRLPAKISAGKRDI